MLDTGFPRADAENDFLRARRRQGYAAVSSTGQVYAYGTVAYHGNPYDIIGPATGIAVTASGSGYAVVTDTGQLHPYGPVRGLELRRPGLLER
jgi:hypothetical protein